ncbi:hypothetical protein ACJA29_01235 [Metamycoplasma sualvi]|uniref:hypothetical protein n=1 Tax=Metamycoplasma sualvi TaxID=2125 RepID=UPI0038733A65
MNNWLSKTRNVVNENLKNKWFVKTFIFSWNLIKNNIYIWSLAGLLIISQSLILLILHLTNTNLINNSLYISLLPQIVLILLNIVLINRLFSESKYNSLDWTLISLPIGKARIFVARFILFFAIGFLALFAQFILNFIICLSTQINTKWILFFFVSNIFINPFINLFYISLFIFIAIFFKRIGFAIASILIVFLWIIPIFTRSLSINQNKLEFNPQNSNSFAQLTVTKNNAVETYIVDKINPIYVNSNKDEIQAINSSPIYSYFIPGEIFVSFDALLMKNIFNINDYENHQIDKNHSLLKNLYQNYNFSNYNNQYTNFLILRPEDINPLFLDNTEYEDLLMGNINNIITTNDNNYIDISNQLLVQQLLENLQSNTSMNWNQLDKKEINTLSCLLGINPAYNQLFYYQRDYSWLSQKTPNLLSKIEMQINPSLANLLQYLWTSENTQNNINNTYGNANPVFDDINNIYPSVKDLDETKAPSSSDIDFIKNSLIRFQNQSIGYLTINGTYQNISSLTNIDPSIVDKASWGNYVDQNTFSVYNARTFLNKLSNSLPNLFAMSFSPNNANLNQYSYYFSIEDNTYLSHSDIYITALVFIFIGSYVIAMNKFKNNNYKNMENH